MHRTTPQRPLLVTSAYEATVTAWRVCMIGATLPQRSARRGGGKALLRCRHIRDGYHGDGVRADKRLFESIRGIHVIFVWPAFHVLVHQWVCIADKLKVTPGRPGVAFSIRLTHKGRMRDLVPNTKGDRVCGIDCPASPSLPRLFPTFNGAHLPGSWRDKRFDHGTGSTFLICLTFTRCS